MPSLQGNKWAAKLGVLEDEHSDPTCFCRFVCGLMMFSSNHFGMKMILYELNAIIELFSES